MSADYSVYKMVHVHKLMHTYLVPDPQCMCRLTCFAQTVNKLSTVMYNVHCYVHSNQGATHFFALGMGALNADSESSERTVRSIKTGDDLQG